LHSISLSLATTTEKSEELTPRNQPESTGAQSSVPFHLTKQKSQKGQRSTNVSDSSVSQFLSEFQAELQVRRLSLNHIGQLTLQQFQICQMAADTIRTDPDWPLPLIGFFQTLKDQEDTPIGSANPNRVAEFV
jgi:hypothetical protein